MAKKPEPPPLSSWSIYKVADHDIGTRWLGTVEAPDKDAAIEKAAQEFKVDARHLYAVRRS
jgi:1,2-phenylacetyl-CoA epoxidase PaaB subunit